MNLTDPDPSAERPLKAESGPAYPGAGDPAPVLGGFAFSAAPAPNAPGVFALTLAVGPHAYPILIGEGADLAAALDAAAAGLPPLPGVLARLWMERPQARQRAHIVRDLVRKLNPPLNGEGRSAPAPAALAALVPDRAAAAFAGKTASVAEATVSEEALDRLVRAFCAAARKDPLLGPIVNGVIADWDRHTELVHDFWSRTLIGTTRYSGFPFTAHIPLNLKPEHFDRWLEIFRAVAPEALPPEALRRALDKVEHMSVCFQAGLTPIVERADA